jgi:hypothetical protein
MASTLEKRIRKRRKKERKKDVILTDADLSKNNSFRKEDSHAQKYSSPVDPSVVCREAYPVLFSFA